MFLLLLLFHYDEQQLAVRISLSFSLCDLYILFANFWSSVSVSVLPSFQGNR